MKMNSGDWRVLGMIFAIIGLGLVILAFGLVHLGRLQAECEAKGGVFYAARGANLCLDPKTVIR